MNKIKKITLNKETLERLTNREANMVAGGRMAPAQSVVQVPSPQGLTPRCIYNGPGEDDDTMMDTCYC